MTQKNQQIIEEFRRRKRKQLVAAGIALLFICPLLFLESADGDVIPGIPNLYIIPFAGATVVSVVIFSLFNWRCPKCHKYLGKRLILKFCPWCGISLTEN